MPKVDLCFWKPPVGTPVSAGFSALAHLLAIGGGVIATLPSAHDARESVLTSVWYIPPPDPKPSRVGATETLRYVELAPDGLGAGLGIDDGPGLALGGARRGGRTAGNLGRDSTTTAESEEATGTDSVYTIIEVDSAAARLPESAAPKYPVSLLQRGIEGQAVVQFVVDTTGVADVASFSVVLASHTEFAQSIRDALPGMRFSTARIGSVKVRQLVELPFSFNIAVQAPLDATAAATPTTKKPE